MENLNKSLKKDLESLDIDISKIDSKSYEAFFSIYSTLKLEINQKKDLIEKLQVILDSTPCTVSWITKDFDYEGVNQTLADTCGLSPEDFINKKIGFFTQNLFFRNFAEALFDSNLKTLYKEVESTINEKQCKFWVVGTKYNKSKNAVIIGVDITEQRHLEENIAFLDKLSSLGEMVASIVHEINNPLAMVKMRAHRVSKLLKKKEYAKIEEHMMKIDSTANTIEKIIRGVKSFVRQGHKDPFAEVNLFELIDEVEAIIGGKLKLNDVKLLLDIDENIMLNINETQIFQIFVNLITNSIDGISKLEKKWIKIFTKVEKNYCYVHFEDSGSGIDDDVVKKMFESFFTTKEIGKGTGLGLSLCKKIMEDHSGFLQYKTSPEGHTQFIVRFNR